VENYGKLWTIMENYGKLANVLWKIMDISWYILYSMPYFWVWPYHLFSCIKNSKIPLTTWRWRCWSKMMDGWLEPISSINVFAIAQGIINGYQLAWVQMIDSLQDDIQSSCSRL
jgi:hypothetical protein